MSNEKRAIRSRLDFSKIPTEIQIPNFHTASCCEGILLENGDFNKEAEVK